MTAHVDGLPEDVVAHLKHRAAPDTPNPLEREAQLDAIARARYMSTPIEMRRDYYTEGE